MSHRFREMEIMAARQAAAGYGDGSRGGDFGLDRWATGRNALIALGLTVVFVGLFALARKWFGLEGHRSIGAPWPLAGPGEVVRIAKGMGPDGRRGTAIITAVLDSFFPLVYGAALAFGSAWLLARLNAPDRIRALRYLPLVGAAFDYLENACILLLLCFFPSANAVAGPLAVFTAGKWLFIFASIIVTLAAGLWLLVRRIAG
jgi:hypothetical protein